MFLQTCNLPIIERLDCLRKQQAVRVNIKLPVNLGYRRLEPEHAFQDRKAGQIHGLRAKTRRYRACAV